MGVIGLVTSLSLFRQALVATAPAAAVALFPSFGHSSAVPR
jgi:hypothetical protein